MWAWLGRIKDTWSWGRFAGQLAGALGITGLISSVGGAVWAVILGVPTPIALMVGYCTLVGGRRALAQSPSNQSTSQSKTAPDYKAWSLVKLITLGDAAYLWCDRDPHVVS